mgnify:CR=1 FL=1
MSKVQRQQAIARIIEHQQVSSQPQLVELLAEMLPRPEIHQAVCRAV